MLFVPATVVVGVLVLSVAAADLPAMTKAVADARDDSIGPAAPPPRRRQNDRMEPLDGEVGVGGPSSDGPAGVARRPAPAAFPTVYRRILRQGLAGQGAASASASRRWIGAASDAMDVLSAAAADAPAAPAASRWAFPEDGRPPDREPLPGHPLVHPLRDTPVVASNTSRLKLRSKKLWLRQKIAKCECLVVVLLVPAQLVLQDSDKST